MSMPSEYIGLYNKIVDSNAFIQDKWYRMSKKDVEKNFIEWYYKETMAIEFSENRSYFRVLFYPTEAEKNRVLSSAGYVPSIKEKVSAKEVEHNPKAILDPNKVIPGVDKESKDPIVAKILEKEKMEAEMKHKKHKEHIEFLRRKREFMDISEDDDL